MLYQIADGSYPVKMTWICSFRDHREWHALVHRQREPIDDRGDLHHHCDYYVSTICYLWVIKRSTPVFWCASIIRKSMWNAWFPRFFPVVKRDLKYFWGGGDVLVFPEKLGITACLVMFCVPLVLCTWNNQCSSERIVWIPCSDLCKWDLFLLFFQFPDSHVLSWAGCLLPNKIDSEREATEDLEMNVG